MQRILVCLDTDAQPSVFDGVVAVDAGVDQLFRHAGVTVEAVRDLVYGAIFTRGPDDLKHTAIFVGGSDVAAGEAVLAEVEQTFFGPLRVSTMLDSNGANTTAAAAVLAARRHLPLEQQQAVVLAATGPVGQRVARLLAEEGAAVRVTSRRFESAEKLCSELAEIVPGAVFEPFSTGDPAALVGASLLVAAGPPGVELVAADQRARMPDLKVAVDLNAVPPAGVGGIDVQDKAEKRADQLCYGALGVGGTKMKIHKAAVARLFESREVTLDAPQIYALGKQLEA